MKDVEGGVYDPISSARSSSMMDFSLFAFLGSFELGDDVAGDDGVDAPIGGVVPGVFDDERRGRLMIFLTLIVATAVGVSLTEEAVVEFCCCS